MYQRWDTPITIIICFQSYVVTTYHEQTSPERIQHHAKMNVASKRSCNAIMSLTHVFRAPVCVLFVAALLVTGHIMFGELTQYVLRSALPQFPSTNIPPRRSCDDGYAAVDAEGNACISLKDFTERTFIHRARTPETTYMYCVIPKNGCSFHIDILHRVNGDLFPGKTKHMPSNKGKIIVTDEQEAAELLSNSSVPKYMVIRNPMMRVLSGYLCKVERHIPEIGKTPAAFQHWAREQFTNLTTWEGVNNHWRAQTTFCGYGMRDIQKRFHVFRVEKPSEYVDFLYKIIPNRILEKGWGQNETSYRNFVLSPHKRTLHTQEKFYDYVGNLETFDLLERTYRKDIDVLGYRDEVAQMRQELARMTGRNVEGHAVQGKN